MNILVQFISIFCSMGFLQVPIYVFMFSPMMWVTATLLPSVETRGGLPVT